jgi:RNA polymerase sigma factor (sigma-70 family)
VEENRAVPEHDDFARLTQLSTQWSLVLQAHEGTPEQVSVAQVVLLDRYSGAIRRYLLTALRDVHAAEELQQDFAVRFLRGDFHRAHPSRGRFRDFIKRSLSNLMIDYRRRQAVQPRPMSDRLPEPASSSAPDEQFDHQFATSWRAELMARAWSALEQLEKQTGQPYHTVLQLRTKFPELRSPELADRLSAILGRPITAGGLRMALVRSRDRFVKFLIDEVAVGLSDPTEDQIQQELIEVGLFKYCKGARE